MCIWGLVTFGDLTQDPPKRVREEFILFGSGEIILLGTRTWPSQGGEWLQEYDHPLGQLTWLCDIKLQGQELYHNMIMA